MDNKRIVERLKKILALSRLGVGGEKKNAQRMLDGLLKKYGMTIADLDDEFTKREKMPFCPKNAMERRLLTQCVAAVVGGWDGACWKMKRRREAWYELTRAEFIEIDLMFSAHRKALAKHLKKQQEVAFSAYIQTNKLFPKRGEDDPREDGSDVDMAEIMAIVGMMHGMKPTPVHKALEAQTA